MESAPTSSFTVRLIPSSATEPFSATSGRMSAGTSTNHPDGLAGLLAAADAADTVDVAEHQVTAQALTQGERGLQIYRVPRPPVAERGAPQRLQGNVGGEGGVLSGPPRSSRRRPPPRWRRARGRLRAGGYAPRSARRRQGRARPRRSFRRPRPAGEHPLVLSQGRAVTSRSSPTPAAVHDARAGGLVHVAGPSNPAQESPPFARHPGCDEEVQLVPQLSGEEAPVDAAPPSTSTEVIPRPARRRAGPFRSTRPARSARHRDDSPARALQPPSPAREERGACKRPAWERGALPERRAVAAGVQWIHHESFLSRKLWDELYLFIAPRVAGEGGLSWAGFEGPATWTRPRRAHRGQQPGGRRSARHRPSPGIEPGVFTGAGRGRRNDRRGRAVPGGGARIAVRTACPKTTSRTAPAWRWTAPA